MIYIVNDQMAPEASISEHTKSHLEPIQCDLAVNSTS